MHWSTLTQTQTKVRDHSGLPWPAQAEPAAIQRRQGHAQPIKDEPLVMTDPAQDNFALEIGEGGDSG